MRLRQTERARLSADNRKVEGTTKGVLFFIAVEHSISFVVEHTVQPI